MVKINELLKMIEAQEKAGGESCTPGTELELGENIVDSYGKVTLDYVKTRLEAPSRVLLPSLSSVKSFIFYLN